jgi:hypothetical protein
MIDLWANSNSQKLQAVGAGGGLGGAPGEPRNTTADGARESRIRTVELQVDAGNTAASEVGEAGARPDVEVDGKRTPRGGRIL